MIGRTLSHYKILEKIGEGGMGEVYLAKDTKLDRDVAVKVLPATFSENKERLARFEREARLLASLNHPNIAAIHELEESDGVHFLALEYVPGETLAERIKRGPIPVDEALPLFKQIAEGLEAAHEKGVIHRDLKPANIKIRPEGKAKVLDFGLAKAMLGETPTQQLSESPTITRDATEAGVLLGTAPYMSPEQARGKAVDKRTDIWAFGCCLYEALTGKAAFLGDTVTDTLAKIVEREPDWGEVPEKAPLIIRSLLRRCLEKGSEQRLRDAGDARIEIEEGLTEPSVPTPVAPKRRGPFPIILAALGAALLASVVVWNLKPPSAPTSPKRFEMVLPQSQYLTSNGIHSIAFSPDGSHFVYVANDRLYLRSIDQMEATAVHGTGDEFIERSSSPFFSPDGQWVGFFSDGKLKKVSISGGTPVTLCDAEIPSGSAWGPNDTIVFGQYEKGIMQVSGDGGTPEVLIAMDSTTREVGYGPEILPGGKEILFTVRSRGTSWDEAQTVVHSLSTGEQQVLLRGGADARYVPTGHLVYAREGMLMAVSFDQDRLEVTGEAVPIVADVMQSGMGAAQFSFSRNGDLVYIPGGAHEEEGVLVWVHRDGGDIELAVQEPLEEPRYARLSPDGRRLAINTGPRGASGLWVYDLTGRPPTPLALEGANPAPVWSPDGTRVAFSSSRAGSYSLYWIPADGSTIDPELLLMSTSQQQRRSRSWSPDGRELIFDRYDPESGWDIFALPMQGEREPRVVAGSQYDETLGMLSSDGRWLAYQSDVTGETEIWVRRYPGAGAPIRISPSGGLEPVWGPEDRELFYLEGDKMMAVAVETEPDFRFGPPKVLFEGRYVHRYRPSYDVAPDGRFLLIQKSSEELPTKLHVVLNWFEELKRLVPTEN
jgi:serine/threonine-protein kinase